VSNLQEDIYEELLKTVPSFLLNDLDTILPKIVEWHESEIKKARFEVAKDIYMAVGITDNPLDTLQAKCDRCQEIMAVNKEEVNDGGTKTVS